MTLRATVHGSHVPAEHWVRRLHVTEGLSELFDVEVELVCLDPDLELEPALWSDALVAVDAQDGADPLHFHGVVEEAEHLGCADRGFLYRLRLRPQVHGLHYRVRSRVFRDLSATDVVRQVLQGAGVPDAGVAWHTTATYPPRALCTQYRESDLDFVLRLLEDEGIFYWFEHAESGHVLHLGDAPGVHTPIAGDAVLSFSPVRHNADEVLTELELRTSVTHNAYAARDWNFRSPRAPLDAEQRDSDGALARYEYPGGFADNADGGRRAANRLAAAVAAQNVLVGATNCRRLAPGRRFSVADARPEVLNREYLATTVEHTFVELAHTEAAARAPGDLTYTARFCAIPADAQFRPARTTPRPRIAQRELAVVTGPAGEEIHVDEFGQIKVHFYWDRESPVDDTASCWIRVQQQNTSGSMVLPRVGWEVDVGFLDGDPDRPVALQKLYNQETMPPYGLPGAKTQAALQSASSPGGGGANELRMQDGNGAMEFALQASRDYGLVAGHDMLEEITADSTETVGQELRTSVGGAEAVTVDADQKLTVAQALAAQTVGAKTVDVSAMDDWGITGGYTITCHAARTDTLNGLMNVLANHVSETYNANCTRHVRAAQAINSATAIVEAVTGSKTETVLGAKLELIRGDKQEQITGVKSLTSGFMSLRAGKDIQCSAQAAMGVTVAGATAERCGGAWTLGARAVVITAASADLRVGGTRWQASGGTLTVQAPDLGASGGAMLKLKGRTIDFKP